jgi:hypothetical protein
MSVAGYIAGNKGGGLKMPRSAEKGEDNVGIQFSGEVLSGEKSVEQRLREVGLRNWPEGSREERYGEAGEYDAVLKDHCWLRE